MMGKKLFPVLLRKNPSCESSRKIFHHASKFFSGLGCRRRLSFSLGPYHGHMVPAYMDSSFPWHHHAEYGIDAKPR